MIKCLFLLSISFLVSFSCSSNKNQFNVLSPDKNIELKFLKNEKGKVGYLIDFLKIRVMDTSYFSFDFKDQKLFGTNLEIVNSSIFTFDETWETVWGEQRFIRNNYNELKVELKEKGENGRKCFVVFRVFNGIVL